MPKIKIINAQTNEEFEREMNSEELAQWEADIARAEYQIQAQLESAAAKSALLAKLGITEEEAKLLLS
jgi:hypothetical protein